MQFQSIPQTSFIPKKPIMGLNHPKTSSSVSFFLIIATMLFIASLAWSAYSYFNRKSMESRIEVAENTIAKNEKSFDSNLLDEVSNTSNRVAVVKNIMNSHLDITKIFDILSVITLSNVRYSNFSYSYGDKEDVKISMSGEAESFFAIAKQTEKYSESPDIRNPLMTNFAISNDGTVTFSFSANIAKKTLKFQ